MLNMHPLQAKMVEPPKRNVFFSFKFRDRANTVRAETTESRLIINTAVVEIQETQNPKTMIPDFQSLNKAGFLIFLKNTEHPEEEKQLIANFDTLCRVKYQNRNLGF
uniref:Uncharacterized protein n=1 Tax=Opuntia streptacantha TaxID=393608 RepID=A0A7C9F9Z5_OPUST